MLPIPIIDLSSCSKGNFVFPICQGLGWSIAKWESLRLTPLTAIRKSRADVSHPSIPQGSRRAAIRFPFALTRRPALCFGEEKIRLRVSQRRANVTNTIEGWRDPQNALFLQAIPAQAPVMPPAFRQNSVETAAGRYILART